MFNLSFVIVANVVLFGDDMEIQYTYIEYERYNVKERIINIFTLHMLYFT